MKLSTNRMQVCCFQSVVPDLGAHEIPFLRSVKCFQHNFGRSANELTDPIHFARQHITFHRWRGLCCRVGGSFVLGRDFACFQRWLWHPVNEYCMKWRGASRRGACHYSDRGVANSTTCRAVRRANKEPISAQSTRRRVTSAMWPLTSGHQHRPGHSVEHSTGIYWSRWRAFEQRPPLIT